MIKNRIKTILNNFPATKATAFIADDLMAGFHLSVGQINTDSGSTHRTLNEAESLSYIEEIFTDYKKYGGIERFRGVVAEVGPGDNAGVALLMRHEGCTQVDLIDRYFSRRNLEQQRRIYESLAQKYQLAHLRINSFWDDQTLAGINWKIGQAAEVYFHKCIQEQKQLYDFVVSRAVLEHLYNPLEAVQSMIACLKPGGRMLHKIDFRDHGMFTPEHHELTFLEFPSFIYRLMVNNSGRPNRILIHRYREVLENMKNQKLIDYSLLVTRLVNVGDIIPHKKFEDIEQDKQCEAIDFVEKHRKKFANEFSQVSSKDLAVSGVFLKVKKN